MVARRMINLDCSNALLSDRTAADMQTALLSSRCTPPDKGGFGLLCYSIERIVKLSGASDRLVQHRDPCAAQRRSTSYKERVIMTIPTIE
jgi:hypothetical protein